MILTNDGDWANLMLHPRYGIEREYAVLLTELPASGEIETPARGIELEDGPGAAALRAYGPPPREVARSRESAASGCGCGSARDASARCGVSSLRSASTCAARPDRIGSSTWRGLRAGDWRPLRRRGGVGALPAAAPRRSARSRGDRDRRPLGSRARADRLRRRAPHRCDVRGHRADVPRPHPGGLEAGVDLDDAAALGAWPACRHRRAPAARGPDGSAGDGAPQPPRRDPPGRTPRIDRAVSTVSAHAEVREAMLAVQRAAARRGDTVMVGRDIGTVVLPEATLKVFLTASRRGPRWASRRRDGAGPSAAATTSPRSSGAMRRTRDGL